MTSLQQHNKIRKINKHSNKNLSTLIEKIL